MATEIKERHYDRVSALVRRDTSDVPPQHLETHLMNRFAAMTFIAGARPDHPSLIPTADGTIERLLFTIPQYAVTSPIMADSYRSLLSTLPANTRLVLLVQSAAENEIRRWLRDFGLDGRSEVTVFDDTLNISIWAEDGYVVAKERASGHTYFIEPYSFLRYGDGMVADFVSNFTDLHDTQAPLYFQGGNVLIGDNFFFIGADYPANSLKYIQAGVLHLPPNQTPQEFIKSLYNEYLDNDRTIFYIGSTVPVPAQQTRQVQISGQSWNEILYTGNAQGTVQPLFHIDMFVTLAGRDGNNKYKVVVGDPSKAYQILGGTPPAHVMQSVFDSIARSLVVLGFEVIRNPLPLAYMDDPQQRERVWYFATSNNALVQNTPGAKKVWLPTYGHGNWAELAQTDNANRELWSQLGFEVQMLGDFHPFAENLGAVHCIKKYLERG